MLALPATIALLDSEQNYVEAKDTKDREAGGAERKDVEQEGHWQRQGEGLKGQEGQLRQDKDQVKQAQDTDDQQQMSSREEEEAENILRTPAPSKLDTNKDAESKVPLKTVEESAAAEADRAEKEPYVVKAVPKQLLSNAEETQQDKDAKTESKQELGGAEEGQEKSKDLEVEASAASNVPVTDGEVVANDTIAQTTEAGNKEEELKVEDGGNKTEQEIPSFSEWTQKALMEEQKKKEEEKRKKEEEKKRKKEEMMELEKKKREQMMMTGQGKSGADNDTEGGAVAVPDRKGGGG